MFVGIAMGRFSYTTMLPPLIQSEQLSELEAGYVGGLNLAAFFLGAFYAERLRNTFSIRRVLTAAVWLGLLALAASALPFGFYWLAAWRALLGAIAGLIMVQSIAFSTAAAPADKRPVAAGYVYAGVGLGVFLSGLFAPWMLQHGIVGLGADCPGRSLCRLGRAMGMGGRRHPAEERQQDAPKLTHALALARPGCRQLPFSFGIVPHTIYWVDFLVRDVGLGMEVAGWHWSVVGLSAFLGPLVTAGCRAHRHFTDAADLLYVARVWGHRPGVSRSGAGIMVLVRLLWRPARPRVHYGGACPGNGVRRGYAAHDASDDSANACGAAVGGLAFPYLFEVSGYGNLFLLGGAAMFLGAIVTLPRECRVANTLEAVAQSLLPACRCNRVGQQTRDRQRTNPRHRRDHARNTLRFVESHIANKTELTLFPGLGTRLMPTSITAAPGLIQSPRTISGRPTAATRISARRQVAGKSAVRE